MFGRSQSSAESGWAGNNAFHRKKIAAACKRGRRSPHPKVGTQAGERGLERKPTAHIALRTDGPGGMDVMEYEQQLTPESILPVKTPVILLIDDNAIQATIRQAILRRAGYLVIAALDPVRALAQLLNGEFTDAIDAVITDHVMPGMNGAEFVRELRKIHTDLPVMVISGLDDAEAEYEGLQVRFLQKPLMPDLLLANLRDLLQQEIQIVA